MSKKLYEESNIQAIANAIREKNNTQNQYTPSQMPNAILQIHGEPDLETLTVTENGNYLPGANKDGFSSVSVNVEGGGGGGDTQYVAYRILTVGVSSSNASVSVQKGIYNFDALTPFTPIGESVAYTFQGTTYTENHIDDILSLDSYVNNGYNWGVQGLSGHTIYILNEGVYAPGSRGKVWYYSTSVDFYVILGIDSQSGVISPLSVTQNGTYTPPSGVDGYAPVTVNVSSGASASTDYLKGQSLVPIMTNNTNPSGVASCSSALTRFTGDDSFEAFRAFDGEDAQSSMTGGWLASQNDDTPWIQYEWDSPVYLSLIKIRTANNSISASKTVFIEGKTINDEWENCLDSGENKTLIFTQGTYGAYATEFLFELNNKQYKAIRIRGTERFFYGPNQTACTISEVKVYSQTGGILPGLGYYGEGLPEQSLGENGNIYTDTLTSIVYQKRSGAWALL